MADYSVVLWFFSVGIRRENLFARSQSRQPYCCEGRRSLSGSHTWHDTYMTDRKMDRGLPNRVAWVDQLWREKMLMRWRGVVLSVCRSPSCNVLSPQKHICRSSYVIYGILPQTSNLEVCFRFLRTGRRMQEK